MDYHILIESAALTYIIITYFQHRREVAMLRGIIYGVASGATKVALDNDGHVKVTGDTSI